MLLFLLQLQVKPDHHSKASPRAERGSFRRPDGIRSAFHCAPLFDQRTVDWNKCSSLKQSLVPPRTDDTKYKTFSISTGLPEEDECCKRCPEGWTQFGDYCYKFDFSEKDWADAEAACIAIGGNPASIHTKDHYGFVKRMIRSATGTDTLTWVGGHNAVNKGVWLWSDGSKFDFPFWGQGEPNNFGGHEHCLELNHEVATAASEPSSDHHSKMASGLCFIVLLCLTSGLLTGTNVAAGNNDPDDRFPEGWTGMGNYCYKFGPDRKTWAEAEAACLAIGGNLASSHTQNHLKFAKEVIKSAAGNDTRTWIGGYETNNKGVWLWSDGTKLDLMPWAPGKPDNADGREHCMELSYQDGANDAACCHKKPYLCGLYV